MLLSETQCDLLDPPKRRGVSQRIGLRASELPGSVPSMVNYL